MKGEEEGGMREADKMVHTVCNLTSYSESQGGRRIQRKGGIK